jgi:hypothetical protein
VLSLEWFRSRTEAKVIIEAWRTAGILSLLPKGTVGSDKLFELIKYDNPSF